MSERYRPRATLAEWRRPAVPAARAAARRTGARPRRDRQAPRHAGRGQARERSRPHARRADRHPNRPWSTGPFVLGAIAGATPGKWIDAWNERMPEVALDLRPIAVADQRAEVLEGGLDAALVRLPLDTDGLHVIDALRRAARRRRRRGLPPHGRGRARVRRPRGRGRDRAAGRRARRRRARRGRRVVRPARDTEEAIAIVASGVGIVIVPMSLARLHHRKDADYRSLRDGPVSTVALAWPADRTTPGGRRVRRHRAGAHRELVALRDEVGGCRRRVPATSPADPAQRLRVPNHAPRRLRPQRPTIPPVRAREPYPKYRSSALRP